MSIELLIRISKKFHTWLPVIVSVDHLLNQKG